MFKELQPAWVLHRRAYGDSGFLVDVYTLHSGRLTVLLRGARRRSRGGSTVGLVQPFIPLLIEFGGRSDLKRLKRVETAGVVIPFKSLAAFNAFYVNELMVRLLPRFDAYPVLFSRYGALLKILSCEGSSSAELALRSFELLLLDELGYGLTFNRDVEGDSVRDGLNYYFDPARGFLSASFNSVNSQSRLHFSGSLLLEIDQWCQVGAILSTRASQMLKMIMRESLAVHLGERPLRSRDVLKSFLRGRKTKVTATVTTIEGNRLW